MHLDTLLTPMIVTVMMRIPDMAAMWLGWTEMPPTSILSFVINSSRFFTCFLSLARRFWNQIFTWEVVKYLIKRGDRVGKNHFFNTCIWISCPTSDSYLVLSTYVDMVLKVDNQLEKLEAAKAAWLVYLSLLSLTGSFLALLGLTRPYWALLGLT